MKAHQRREHAQRIVSLRTFEPGSLTVVRNGLDILLKCEYISHHLLHPHCVDSPDILSIGYQKTLHEAANSLEDEPIEAIGLMLQRAVEQKVYTFSLVQVMLWKQRCHIY